MIACSDKVGRELVTDPALLLALPIINLPEGIKRIRVRHRDPMVYLFVRTANALTKNVCGYARTPAGELALELIPLGEGNYTR